MKDFHPVTELFDNLVEQLPDQHYNLWHKLGHIRVETGFRGRRFLVYQIDRGQPGVIDTLTITDYLVDSRDGARMFLASDLHGEEIQVGYRPAKLWGYRAFMALPLHSQVRWSSAGELEEGKLAFPVLIKQQSRFSMRDVGVDMVETTTSYAREFNPIRE